MEVLRNAVKAKVPVITVTTTDILNAAEVIAHIIGKTPKPLDTGGTIKPGVYISIGDKINDAYMLDKYPKFMTAQASLVVVNPAQKGNAFDAGMLPTPPQMLNAYLMDLVDNDAAEAQQLALALGGCTLREADEICRLTMANTGAFTAKGIGQTRRSTFQGQKGLTPVDTYQLYYEPNEQLAEYAAREQEFFFNPGKPEFQPRGLLMDGWPGTGKSSGAKWLADLWGVPLFRLSLGDTKNKYVGSSQEFLAQALASIDAQEPCIVLWDEIEKAVGRSPGESDGGTSTDMLGSALWWLQEHKTRVLSIMTTNDRSIIPPELYRPGRIDEVIWVGGLTMPKAVAFVTHYVKALKVQVPKGTKISATAIAQAAMADNPLTERDGTKTVSPAALQQWTIKAIKYAAKA